MYTYYDPITGKRKFIYAVDLPSLRDKEKQFMKERLNGLDVYLAGSADINYVFDRYMSTKTERVPFFMFFLRVYCVCLK